MTRTRTVDVLGADATGAQVDEVVAFVARLQADPSTHVIYLGIDEATVRSELADAHRWMERTFVARDGDGTVVGVLTADVAEERRRVWWLGPWAVDAGTADALLRAASRVVDELVDAEEFCPDSRNPHIERLALARGCAPHEPAIVLTRSLLGPQAAALPVAGSAVRPLQPVDHAAVARLHDELFPDTHTLGDALVAAEDTRIHVWGEPPAGYVATQVQADGGGYVDFLGVAPSARRTGVARDLLVAALHDLVARDVPSVHLTVRESNGAARSLYGSLGFDEERIAVPFRRGIAS